MTRPRENGSRDRTLRRRGGGGGGRGALPAEKQRVLEIVPRPRLHDRRGGVAIADFVRALAARVVANERDEAVARLANDGVDAGARERPGAAPR